MRVVHFFGLLPYPTRSLGSVHCKSHVLMADNIIPENQSAAIPVLQRHDEQQRDAGEQSDENRKAKILLVCRNAPRLAVVRPSNWTDGLMKYCG